MRIAVLSDVHSNLPALEAVLEDAARNHAETILALGDLANGGPFPGEVLATLHRVQAMLVRGNHEEYLRDFRNGAWPAEKAASAQWGAVRWTLEQLTADEVAKLTALPEQRSLTWPGLPALRLVHGTLQSSRQGLIPAGDPIAASLFREAGLLPEDEPPGAIRRPEEALAAISEGVLACGHTHIPWLDRVDGKLAFNPGAVGAPLTGDPQAQYAILSDGPHGWQVQHRRVPYDVARVRRAFRQSGLLEYAPGLARACLDNVETGRNVAFFFVVYAHQLAHSRGVATEPAIPPQLWNEACRTFPWQRYET